MQRQQVKKFQDLNFLAYPTTNIGFVAYGYTGAGKSTLLQELLEIMDEMVKLRQNSSANSSTTKSREIKSKYLTVIDTKGMSSTTAGKDLESERKERVDAGIQNRIPEEFGSTEPSSTKYLVHDEFQTIMLVIDAADAHYSAKLEALVQIALDIGKVINEYSCVVVATHSGHKNNNYGKISEYVHSKLDRNCKVHKFERDNKAEMNTTLETIIKSIIESATQNTDNHNLSKFIYEYRPEVKPLKELEKNSVLGSLIKSTTFVASGYLLCLYSDRVKYALQLSLNHVVVGISKLFQKVKTRW